MKEFAGEQRIAKLEKRKGGYFYLKVDAEIVNQFENKRKTRFICRIDNILEFQCGLNHLGDGNNFIILSMKNLLSIEKKIGDTIKYTLMEDPNPLGVDMPEVLSLLLEQDNSLKELFENLSLGKKRNIIHQMIKIKDIDRQVEKTIGLINSSNLPRRRKHKEGRRDLEGWITETLKPTRLWRAAQFHRSAGSYIAMYSVQRLTTTG